MTEVLREVFPCSGLRCVCFYNGALEKHWLTRIQKRMTHQGWRNQGLTFLRFWSEVGKSTLRGCLASLGNDGILELFALSAKIFGAELNYCVSRMNPNAANWDLVPPTSKILTPQARCQVLVYFRGFRWRSLYALQTTCSQIFPFRIHGLGTWIMSWSFLTFIASICWSLDNLVSAPLSLEVQS